jgi:hypothetical protein
VPGEREVLNDPAGTAQVITAVSALVTANWLEQRWDPQGIRLAHPGSRRHPQDEGPSFRRLKAFDVTLWLQSGSAPVGSTASTRTTATSTTDKTTGTSTTDKTTGSRCGDRPVDVGVRLLRWPGIVGFVTQLASGGDRNERRLRQSLSAAARPVKSSPRLPLGLLY